ncbi:MAG: hypothetical protein P4L49_20995 [Desulfosporosinus sp.]|nr:hypothetical protein [Desulfosporosinus sp.]
MAKRKWSIEEIEEYRKTHNKYLYYNGDDANIVVPKANQILVMGKKEMTVNWSHPMSKIFALVLLVVFMVTVFLDIKYGIK